MRYGMRLAQRIKESMVTAISTRWVGEEVKDFLIKW